MLFLNKRALDREIEMHQIDKDSSEKEDIQTILDELWEQGDDMEAIRQDVHKVSDLYNHIPDGTMPVLGHDDQTEIFEELEFSLNQTVDESHWPMVIPEEIKILATLTGGIIGPGFPKLQESTIVSALELDSDEATLPKDLIEKTGLSPDWGWDVIAGFQYGYSTYCGSAYVVYGRCTDSAESEASDLNEFGWVYIFSRTPDMDFVTYGCLVEYLTDYTAGYAEHCMEENDCSITHDAMVRSRTRGSDGTRRIDN
ncbi:hypothetical protein GLAREA_04851 [Glarea lozoyensis ATCC 20868]|uniref:Uncharacterized protein n=1 Tax=Glarea lozoyensis (strain ATCC 20868 / MF5171) TaxID=1116229 RepID=S3CQV2_GLAL2|nr:uncharacterized protein GLAREA_04851 [Glarea lozoyensis ATCC 20868]EPE28060.1 hypothetical protein GLAREA_04851 [Glarea lozoyensis ATCC 20868]